MSGSYISTYEWILTDHLVFLHEANLNNLSIHFVFLNTGSEDHVSSVLSSLILPLSYALIRLHPEWSAASRSGTANMRKMDLLE